MSGKKILVICGPTATGKTELGLHLSRRLPSEIISADSRQVYKGMDVGTGKNMPESYRLIASNLEWNGEFVNYHQIDKTKLWGYDLASPDEDFSLSHFAQYSNLIVEDIYRRQLLPIVVGGTGLYLKSFSDNLTDVLIKPNPILRRELGLLAVPRLQEYLQQLDSNKASSMNNSDFYNPRRLIRAIEIAKHRVASKIPNKQVDQHLISQGSSNLKSENLPGRANQLWIGLTAPVAYLEKRVAANVRARSQRMSEELSRLTKTYHKFWALPAASATGYSQWHLYQTGKVSKSEALDMWVRAETQYVRRQMTWFKKQRQICWFDVSKTDWQSQVELRVETWYRNSG